MKNLLCLLSLLITTTVASQTWAPLTVDENKEGLELNPLKGFADLYGPENSFPRSINGRLFGLNEVMTGFDTYDFTVIDNFIEANKLEGNFTYIQVNIDPGFGESYMPEFLIPVACENDNMAGGPLDGTYCEYNFTSGLPDLVPDWNDEDVVSAMERFIAKFGEEYDDRSEVFMVHLGLYGIFGEWQIGSAANEVPGFEMTLQNKARVANAFRVAFPKTQLIARYPEHMPDPELYGYSDGLFFTQSISDNAFFNHFFFDNTIAAYNANNNWRTQVIGGEIDPCVQPQMWLGDADLSEATCPDGNTVEVQDIEESLITTHSTFLFTHHVFQNNIGPTEGSQEWNNALSAQKFMGYTFHINEYRLTAQNEKPSIEVNIQNIGIAPIYANWNVEFAAIDSNDQLIPLGAKPLNLNLIQPDVLNNYRSYTSEVTLLDGNYTMIMRVENPLELFSTAAQPVRFANATQDADQDGWLTLGDATIKSGTLGSAPIPVSGIELSDAALDLIVGNTQPIDVVINPTGATDQSVTWVSDHPGTAFVDQNGLVSAGPSYGSAKIFAYSNDVGIGGAEAPVAVVDVNVEPVRVTIPALIEAEHFVRMSGIVSGFGKLGFIDNGDWMEYGITVEEDASFFLDIYAGCPGDEMNPCPGEILIKDGEAVLATVDLVNTVGFDDFKITTSAPIALQAGEYIVELEAVNGQFDLDKIEFRLDTNSDTDTDGVPDLSDNCLNVANSDQNDTDADGYGNACDADFNNDCVINFLDVASFANEFLGSNVLFDLNSDGAVNFLDFVVVSQSFLQAPGPGLGICE